MFANDRIDVDEVMAGDIAASLGFKESSTGDTFSDDNFVLESISFPEPVIHIAVEPKSTMDQEKMGEALSKLADEDPTFRVATDEETGQTIMSGMGELHLEILIDRMKREHKVEVNQGPPQVAYREKITLKNEVDYTHKKQSGGAGQFGRVKIVFEPLESGEGFVFENKIVGGAIPREFIGAVEDGIIEAALTGVLGGYPMVDVKVAIVDGTFHEVDSSEIAFKMAGIFAFKDACKKAAPIMLEPIMSVEAITPEEHMGDVVGDLNSRRGRISHIEARSNSQIIHAHVPLAQMFGYATALRSLSKGRASYSMEPLNFQKVPDNILTEIMAKSAGASAVKAGQEKKK